MKDADPIAGPLSVAHHHFLQDRHDAALEALRRLPADAWERPRPWAIRAGALYLLDRERDALDAARKGLSTDPEHTGLLLLMARSHTCLGELPEAEAAALRGLSADPEDPSLLCAYAEVCALADQSDKARQLLQRAAAIDPQSKAVQRSRWLLAHLDGDDRAARQAAWERLQDAPGDSSALVEMGVQELVGGRTTEGGRLLSRAASADLSLVESMPEVYDEVRLWRHPLMLPLRPLQKLGTVWTWIGAVATLLVLQQIDMLVAGIFAFTYLAWCIYSWVVPPLLRRHLRRRRFTREV